MKRVLLVDDDETVLRDNRRYFEQQGYEVICAATARRAEEIIATAALDCVVLDVDLPDESGFSLCVRLREHTGLPIVFLSGYTQAESRVKGLAIGGDDYLCKPYSLAELGLRVAARIRAGRMMARPQPLRYGLLVIDPGTRSVTYADRSADFSTYEFDVLYFLARNPGQVFTYEQIFDQVWKAPVNRGLKSLQMMIVRVRQKLLELCPERDYIQTIRRKGYLFVQ